MSNPWQIKTIQCDKTNSEGNVDIEGYGQISILLDKYVLKEKGKGLSSNDFTNEDVAKLNSVEFGSEVNKLETLSINNGPKIQSDSEKNINISIPVNMSDLVNDEGFAKLLSCSIEDDYSDSYVGKSKISFQDAQFINLGKNSNAEQFGGIAIGENTSTDESHDVNINNQLLHNINTDVWEGTISNSEKADKNNNGTNLTELDVVIENLATETSNRISEDNILKNKIDNIDVEFSTDLDEEIQNRISEDNILKNKIDDIDIEFSTNLDEEIQNRISEDNLLKQNISDIQELIPSEASDVNNLADKSFVTNITDTKQNSSLANPMNIDGTTVETVELALSTLNTKKSSKDESVGGFTLTMNSSTYEITLQAKNVNGENLGNAQVIDLPLESVVVNGSYDSETQQVILTLKNGSTIEFSVADLVDGLQTEITGAGTSIVNDDLTPNRVVVSDVNGKIADSDLSYNPSSCTLSGDIASFDSMQSCTFGNTSLNVSQTAECLFTDNDGFKIKRCGTSSETCSRIATLNSYGNTNTSRPMVFCADDGELYESGSIVLDTLSVTCVNSANFYAPSPSVGQYSDIVFTSCASDALGTVTTSNVKMCHDGKMYVCCDSNLGYVCLLSKNDTLAITICETDANCNYQVSFTDGSDVFRSCECGICYNPATGVLSVGTVSAQGEVSCFCGICTKYDFWMHEDSWNAPTGYIYCDGSACWDGEWCFCCCICANASEIIEPSIGYCGGLIASPSGTQPSWGNQTGTAIASWNDSTGGSMYFRRDNPTSGQLSMVIDGTVYVDEGRYGVIHEGNIGNQTVANANYASVSTCSCHSAGLLIDGVTWDSRWHWSGQNGQPSWLWGSNDGSNMYVWNPANFSVAYASNAGKVDVGNIGTATCNLVYAQMGDNDFFRIQVGGGSNDGYAEIATADDGNEPIYVRQWTGVFANLVRTATLLDSSGNTSFPGSITSGGSTVTTKYYLNNCHGLRGSLSGNTLYLYDSWS